MELVGHGFVYLAPICDEMILAMAEGKGGGEVL